VLWTVAGAGLILLITDHRTMAHYVAGATRNCGDLHHSTGRNLGQML
jgi:hypothetical protein